MNDPAFTNLNGVLDLLHPARVRTFTNLTFWANFRLGGDSPFGFHLVNLLLHLGAVWFAYGALTRLLPPTVALLATAVFALHPLQAEPVAYVFARTTLLCGLFCWASIFAWVRGRYWWAVGACALALLSKEEAVALPVFFALLQITVPRNLRHWRPIGLMFGLALATGVRGLLATAVKGTGAGLDVAMPPLDYALAQGIVIARYLRLFILPVGLNFDPDIAIDPWTGAALWCGLVGGLLYLFRTNPRAAFWYAAGLVFLSPTSSLIPIADLAADRRMYLAAPCFAAVIGLMLPTLKTSNVVAVGVLLAGLSFARTMVFGSAESLWRETAAASPEKLRPRIQLSRAVPPTEALKVLGNDPRLAAERGRVYMDLHQASEALREFGVALAAAPGDPNAITNRGTALAALNQLPAAQRDFLEALKHDPCLYPALLNLKLTGGAVPPVTGCRFTNLQRERLGLN